MPQPAARSARVLFNGAAGRWPSSTRRWVAISATGPVHLAESDEPLAANSAPLLAERTQQGAFGPIRRRGRRAL